nr:MFS transporter [Gammaproteobacteria bacterium]
RMAMPALGGILIAVFDTWVIFALGACGFLAMAATLTTIALRPHRTATRAGVAELLHGVGYVFRQRAFFTLIPLTYALMFLGTSYLNLMPLFADAIGTSEWGYGLLISAAGVGSVIGTLWIGRYQRSPRLGWWMLAGLVGSCASLFAFVAALAAYAVGWLTSSIALGLALTFNFSMALASSIFLVMSMTTLQLLVPDQLRGRVMSIHGITFSLIPLGALLGGALAQWWNAPGALLIHAGLLTLVVVLVFGSQRWLRQLDGLALAPGHDGSARGTHG